MTPGTLELVGDEHPHVKDVPHGTASPHFAELRFWSTEEYPLPDELRANGGGGCNVCALSTRNKPIHGDRYWSGCPRHPCSKGMWMTVGDFVTRTLEGHHGNE